jgi:hypothetical protein
MVLSKFNPKKNSDLKNRIGIIGTTAANMNRETILMIFLLQDCSEEVFNTRKVKIQCFKQKELESSNFRHKTEKSDVLTVNVFSLDREGFDFKDIKDVLKIIQKESHPVIDLLLVDAEKRTSESDQAIFGQTLGDQLGLLQIKHAGNPEQLYLAARKVLTDRTRAIAKCLEEFAVPSKGQDLETKEDSLTFASLKSKQDVNLLHLVGHQNPKLNLDIIFQKHVHEKGNVHENVISFGKRAQKYLPAILAAILKVELTGWSEKDGLIYSNPNNISMISFEAMRRIIAEAVLEFDSTPVEAIAEVKGDKMPDVQHGPIMKHEIQTDSAMSMASVG